MRASDSISSSDMNKDCFYTQRKPTLPPPHGELGVVMVAMTLHWHVLFGGTVA